MVRKRVRSKTTKPAKRQTEKMHLRVSVWVEDANNKLLFGEGRLQILEAVAAHGSLSAAAEALGMSYRGLWARIRYSEKRLGYSLIESHVGRGPSSGTSLTPEGKDMVVRYSKLRARVEADAEKAYRSIFLSK